ncbi:MULTISPECIES: LytR/AlgR family response regulator transcription factor [Lutimonas]|uniref:LytR/AlgR family response regulator transcription factor n=1 Tax=Lutimonas TaxID=449810 RepID=UPI001CD23D75|nr:MULTISPECIES: LytTR family DNA-binding domain-containing protein [Lutimonas]MCA0931744.1 LytTR family DNA-binding domain-containing protein [Lutimonas saemankumensis]WKK67503.1 LytTR family DNA-binding domain-containing protein [Lutimonas sp. YSD2104]
MKTYKTIIIDDERLAREEVKRALSNYPEFEVLGEAANADEAIVLIEKLQPDLLFLDIHMPEKSGFDLLEELTMVPEVVFTTAYDQYAVQAFEVNALDYLVKPLREERFAMTIEKIKAGFSKPEVKKDPLPMHYKIFIKDGEQCHFIPLSDVRLIQSMDNYARLFFNEEKAMIKRSLNLLQEKLDPNVFFRINRSQIINTHYIKEIHPYFNNKLQITLTSGEKLEVSSRQSAKFKNWNSL